MATSQFDRFLQEATTCDRDSGATLERDPLYGLYTSWCHVTGNAPRPERSFWADARVRIGAGHNGLRMRGPAAADYILNSCPGLV